MLYAFAEPVRETFRSMYGREVTRSWQDCERVRRIRGDFYTGFFRDAHKVTAAAGKKLIAHLEHGIEVPPCTISAWKFIWTGRPGYGKA
jgi:hypothetical protein